jgi:hypothetical protein
LLQGGGRSISEYRAKPSRGSPTKKIAKKGR